jgi:4-amino-4-deoxy-L-arabinose transferase-like glycosyltransferase
MRTHHSSSLFWWLLFGLVFVVGLSIRLYDLADPPLDFHPTRQLHSALIARGMYLQEHGDVPDWQRQMAVQQWRMEGIIEPQVMEAATAWVYTLTGGIDLRIPRLFAIFFWMAAALFTVLLVIELVGLPGALVAALFFLTWSYGVTASRAFQPEPLMIALTAAALWAAVRWERSQHWHWAILAGLLAGLAIYIKSVTVFQIAPALAVLVLSRHGVRAVRSPQVWVMLVLSILPPLLYYLDGIFLRGYLLSQFSARFFPQMWLDPAFYLRWIRNLSRLLPFVMLLVSAAGVFLLQRSAYRAMLLGLWAGYLVFGLTLPHHISTHDYYHLPLVLPVSIGLAAIGQTLYTHFQGPRWLVRLGALGLLLAVLVFNAYDARTTLKRFDAAAQADAWTQIGVQLGPEASVTALVSDYGSALKYWSWINPLLWPARVDMDLGEDPAGQAQAIRALFEREAAGKHYFLVSRFDEFSRQPELQELLYQNYTVLAQTTDYIIFDLQSPAK